MKFRSAILAALLLGACSGNPMGDADTGGTDTGGTGVDAAVTVPKEVAVNLRSISYSSAKGGQLRVNMDGLVGSPKAVKFVRAKSLDIAGYQAFTYQETTLQRKHLAFVSTNDRGTLRTAVVADGGQFNRKHGGGTFARLKPYSAPIPGTKPETGQYSYAGTYAGVFLPGPGTHPSLPDGLQPYTPLRVKGQILMTANFANTLVEGGVDNRWLLDAKGNKIDFNGDGEITNDDKLLAIDFAETKIKANGTFLGDVEFSGEPDAPIGKVGGLFGGQGAPDIAGVTEFNPIKGNTGIWEYGTFNLPRCGKAGQSPVCKTR